MDQTQIRARAIDRAKQFRRWMRSASAESSALHEEAEAARQAYMQAEGELVSYARRQRFDYGARFTPEGKAIGLRTQLRPNPDGRGSEVEVVEERVPALDGFAAIAARRARELAEVRAMQEAAAERHRTFGPLADAAEQALAARGWLAGGEQAVGTLLPNVGSV